MKDEKMVITSVDKKGHVVMEPIEQALKHKREEYESVKMELEIAQKNREIRIMRQRIRNLNDPSLDNSNSFSF